MYKQITTCTKCVIWLLNIYSITFIKSTHSKLMFVFCCCLNISFYYNQMASSNAELDCYQTKDILRPEGALSHGKGRYGTWHWGFYAICYSTKRQEMPPNPRMIPSLHSVDERSDKESRRGKGDERGGGGKGWGPLLLPTRPLNTASVRSLGSLGTYCTRRNARRQTTKLMIDWSRQGKPELKLRVRAQ